MFSDTSVIIIAGQGEDIILGASLTELARRLNMSVPAVGYSVERGEMIADKNDLRLTE